jgi:DHHC palmitoyltransferase
MIPRDASASDLALPVVSTTHNENTLTRNRNGKVAHTPQPALRWIAFPRYVFLSAFAILLTLSCPGNTRLWMNSTDDSIFLVHRLLLVQLLLVYIFTLIGFLIVHWSDPGFITKEILLTLNEGRDDENIVQHLLLSSNDDRSNESESPTVEMINLNVNNDVESSDRYISHSIAIRNDNNTGANVMDNSAIAMAVTTRRSKYCQTCQLQPLIRSHHCKICNHCVATFDHHCGFMGICIGERNHGCFWIFLLCQAIGFYICCSIAGSSSLGWTTILFPKPKLNHVHWYDPLRVIVAKLYLYPLTLVAWIMLAMHTFFLFSNVTTFECSKGPRHIDYLQGTQDMDLPYSQGLVGNIRFCCVSDGWLGRPFFPRNSNLSAWKPTLWRTPGKIIRDSPDWWNHPWQNKYWSCC